MKTLKQLEAEKEKIEKQIKEIKNKNNWIKVKLSSGIIEVQEKVNKMTYIEAEKYCKENNVRMLNVLEAGEIFDNNLIKDFVKEREWISHYSSKTRKLGYGCSVASLDSVDRQLNVVGSWDDSNGGYAFGVRFVKIGELKDE